MGPPTLKIVGSTDADAYLRMVEIAIAKHRRGEGEEAAARLAVTGALNLYAEHASAGDAALMAAEVLSSIAIKERRKRRDNQTGSAS